MADKQLKAKVSIDTGNATRSLDKLITKIERINTVINKSSGKALEKSVERRLLQQEKLNQATAKTRLAEAKVTTQIYRSNNAKNQALISEERLSQAKLRTAEAERRVEEAANRSNRSTSALLRKVKSLVGAYLGMKGAQLVITASDTVTKAQNKFNLMEGGSEAKTSETMDRRDACRQGEVHYRTQEIHSKT